MIYIVYCG